MSRRLLSTIFAQLIAIGAIAAATTLLPVATTAEARIALNGLSENRLAANKLAVNRLAANKLATNRIATNRIATNRIATNRISLNGVTRPGGDTGRNPLEGMDRKPIAR